ncbi:hypothetical protein HK17_12660, partial [Acetobacter indonesiensis]
WGWGYPGWGWGAGPYAGGGWGWGWGAPFVFGSALGLAVGSAVAASSADDGYEDPTIYAPPSYYYSSSAQPASQPVYSSYQQPSAYNAAPQTGQQSDVVHCSAGRFFNSLTESCDKR